MLHPLLLLLHLSHPFLVAPPTVGPHKAFVQIDGLWLALEQGYAECSRSYSISDIHFSRNHAAVIVNEMLRNEKNIETTSVSVHE